MDGAGRGHYDVVVVGGGIAGLSAALVLGRSRRRALVVDAGEPRNAPSPGVHSFFSRDGILPADLLRIGREQLEPYPSVEHRDARVAGVGGTNGAFTVVLEGGEALYAHKLVLATGVADGLPETPGFRELWGTGVLHCPYCHGWEVRDRPLAVHGSGESVLERATLIRHWSPDLIVVSDGPLRLGEEGRAWLTALGVGLREEKIARLEGGDGALSHIVFEDGSELEREALFYLPPQLPRTELAESLGCETVEAGPARIVKSDPMTRETTVPGVYVAGDVGNPLPQAVYAASTGATAAFFANNALVAEDAEAEVREAVPAAGGEAAFGENRR